MFDFISLIADFLDYGLIQFVYGSFLFYGILIVVKGLCYDT